MPSGTAVRGFSPIRHYRIRTTRAIALALLSGFTIGAAPIGYDLTVVAKTGDVISGKTLTGFHLPSLGPNAAAIDSGGGVAFYAMYSEGGAIGDGIFTPASLVLKTGDVINGRTLEGIGFVPALNDHGTVAVRGLLDSQVILTSNARRTGGASTIGGQIATEVGPPAINNNGTVAFVGSFSSGTGIFIQTAKEATLLAKTGEAVAGVTMASFGPPAINDRGTVAFQGWFLGWKATAIVTPTTVLVKAGDTIDGKTLTDLFFGPALNSSDTVAFVGAFTGGTGIFTQKALLVRSGDTVGGQKLTSFGLPVIDDRGTAAFLATYPGGAGIFTQSTLIAKTGDTVCGKTLAGAGPPAINRGGEVAFSAWFSDGSSAIMLARPIVLQSGRISRTE
jgi:hypothetical protein